jgi:hypothetical protein
VCSFLNAFSLPFVLSYCAVHFWCQFFSHYLYSLQSMKMIMSVAWYKLSTIWWDVPMFLYSEWCRRSMAKFNSEQPNNYITTQLCVEIKCHISIVLDVIKAALATVTKKPLLRSLFTESPNYQSYVSFVYKVMCLIINCSGLQSTALSSTKTYSIVFVLISCYHWRIRTVNYPWLCYIWGLLTKTQQCRTRLGIGRSVAGRAFLIWHA